MSGIAAIVTVAVTALLGWLSFQQGQNGGDPNPSPVAYTISVTYANESSTSTTSEPPTDAAPPADVGANALVPPVASITSIAWREGGLHAEGVVSGASGPLWILARRPEQTEWLAKEAELESTEAAMASSTAWHVVFTGLTQEDGYELKLRQDWGGFGANAGPDEGFAEYLASGGADEPSEILEVFATAE